MLFFDPVTPKRVYSVESLIDLKLPEPVSLSSDRFLATLPLVDLHAHVRLAGGEDYNSLCAAALAGGFGVLNIQPNTKPPLATLDVLNEHLKLSSSLPVRFLHTVSLFGELDDLNEASQTLRSVFGGASNGISGERTPALTGFSTDGLPYDSRELLEALRKKKPALLFDHSQLHEVPGSFYIGSDLPDAVRSYSNEAIAIFRTVATGLECGFTRFHVQHVSTALGVETIGYLKRFANVTSELTPHHAFFTPDMITSSNQKINPPISKDRDELVRAVKSGLIDAFATDHAPHPPKPSDYSDAPYGSSHIEVALSVFLTVFDDPFFVLEKLTSAPLGILGLSYETLGFKFPDDLIIIDLAAEYTVDTSNFLSKGKNCAFEGYRLCGKVLGFRRNGRWVYWNGELLL